MSVRWLQSRLYPEAASRDPLPRFLRVVESYLQPPLTVLDLGAGAGGQNTYQLKGRVQRIVGVDVDARVKENPLLDEGVQADVTRMPFADSSFDLAFAIYVLEHIDNPASLLQEIRRVLRPGGYFLALTPNRYHYVSLISALTPTRFHKWVNKKRGRPEEDTFPTFYRMNSRRVLKRLMAQNGFAMDRLDTVEFQPNYLTFSTPTFLFGAAYERLVNRFDWLAGLRVNIIGVFRNCPKGVS